MGCKKAREFLAHKKVEVEERNLLKQSLSKDELRALAKKAGGLEHLVAPKRRAEAEGVPDEPERRMLLAGALAKLSRRQREVLELVFQHGMTVEEAGEAMGVSVGTARVHHGRGKKRLLERLGGQRR